MQFFLPVAENIQTTGTNILQNEDEDGNEYSIFDVTMGYNKDFIIIYGTNIYRSSKTQYPLAHYTWKNLVVGSEYATNLHTQTDIYPDVSEELWIDIVDNVTVVYVESNSTYYIANKDATVDFMAESIGSPANFNEITAPPPYRKEYNYPEGFGSTLYWEYVSVSNRQKAFDKAVGSQTEKEDEITYRFLQNSISSIIFLNVEASEIEVQVTDLITSTVYPLQTRDMIDTSHLDTYEKVCTQLPVQLQTATFKFGSAYSMQIDVAIKNPSSVAKVGVIKFGLLEDIGMTLDDVEVGNRSYNESGIRENGEYVWNPTDKESNKTSIINYDIMYDTLLFDAVDRKIKQITDKDIVLLGDERDEDAFTTLQSYCVVTSSGATLSSKSQKSHASLAVETFA
jgi:hypothetical protein